MCCFFRIENFGIYGLLSSEYRAFFKNFQSLISLFKYFTNSYWILYVTLKHEIKISKIFDYWKFEAFYI